jgi:hypothetical protein
MFFNHILTKHIPFEMESSAIDSLQNVHHFIVCTRLTNYNHCRDNDIDMCMSKRSFNQTPMFTYHTTHLNHNQLDSY